MRMAHRFFCAKGENDDDVYTFCKLRACVPRAIYLDFQNVRGLYLMHSSGGVFCGVNWEL